MKREKHFLVQGAIAFCKDLNLRTQHHLRAAVVHEPVAVFFFA